MFGYVLSESTNKTGLYEHFQDLTKTSTSNYSLYKFARDANDALGQFNLIALMASQKWEHDDTRNTVNYPIIGVDIISGQQDYPLSTDVETTPNQILDIVRVERADSSGNWTLLTPYDQTEESNSLTQLAKTGGVPTRYDKLANGVWLDPKPNYNRRLVQEGEAGLKVWFGRTPVYFLGDATDNSVKAGIPDPFHPYLFYLPAYLYCVTNLPNLAAGYLAIVRKMEEDIKRFYLWRNRDEKKQMKANVENCR